MSELKVGDVWIGANSGISKQILAIGCTHVFFRELDSIEKSEMIYNILNFSNDHTLKKPEPKLTKIVAYIEKETGATLIVADNTAFFETSLWDKKPIIVKDNVPYVVEG